VKASTDPQPEIKRIPIKVTEDGVAQGTVEDVQSFWVRSDKKYEVPAAIKDGSSFPDTKESKEKKEGTKQFSKSTSTNSLVLEQKGAPENSQAWARDGVFRNFVQAPFELINMGEKIIIKSYEAQYKNQNGEWVSVDVLHGYRRGYYDYAWDHENTSRPIEPKTPVSLALGIVLNVRARQVNCLRRIHHSLPIPLEVKFTLLDVNGGRCSIEIKADNETQPLSLSTKESRLEYYKKRHDPNDIWILVCG